MKKLVMTMLTALMAVAASAQVQVLSENHAMLRLEQGKKYVLLPVYLINCTYQGQKYQYAVNGQTGKVVGTLPISNRRKWSWFFGVFAAVFAAVFALGLLLQ